MKHLDDRKRIAACRRALKAALRTCHHHGVAVVGMDASLVLVDAKGYEEACRDLRPYEYVMQQPLSSMSHEAYRDSGGT
jgi:hypothetical protein